LGTPPQLSPEAEAARKEAQAAREAARKHHIWEALNKALNTLMVGHAAGLVTCLTLMKDYKENARLEELGTFILLFGTGLVVAVFSVMAWTVGPDFVVLPKGRGWFRWPSSAARPSTPSASPTSTEEKRVKIPQPEWFWMTALFALYSTACMAAAIIIAIFQFRDL
jgi:hypothetical protein